MKAILVCDDEISQNFFISLFTDVKGIELVRKFADPAPALEYAIENPIAFAVLDIEKLKGSRLDLGRELKNLYPDVSLIYINSNHCPVSNHSQMPEKMRIRADYCIMIALDRTDILNLTRKAKSLKKERVKAVMFGRFQFFVRGQLVSFGNAKAKELLALCLDHRGGEVSMEEAVDKLWPNRAYDERVKRLYRKAVLSLQATLQQAGVGEIFVTRRGACHVNVSGIECDYYRFLETKDRETCLYGGNYLFDYEWGEETLALLERIAGDTDVRAMPER